MNETPTTTPQSREAYGYFVGPIDQQAVQRIANGFTVAQNNGIGRVHMLFQSSGGTVSDGVCLHNIFRSCPLDLHLYNAGSIASAGVVAYLGAATRKTSQHATFMIHKTFFSPVGATTDRLQSAVNMTTLDDQRIENILHSNITLPADKWDAHRFADLWLSAEEAITSKLATEKAEFAPPKGDALFYVGPI